MKRTIIFASIAALALACGCARRSAVTGAGPGTITAAILRGGIIDLTYGFGEDTVYWPTARPFELTREFQGFTDGGFYYEANSFRAAEHGGTHIDAPVHFAEGGETVDSIPLRRLIGGAVVVDVAHKAMADPDYEVSVADFRQWESVHGRIPAGSILLLRTGFGRFWPEKESYMGTGARGPEAAGDLHFPGLSPVAAEWLVEHRRISAVGLDTPSIDRGQSTLFESHQILFRRNIPAFENVANLDRLPPTGTLIIALPMKIRGGSGAPLRIIAVLPER